MLTSTIFPLRQWRVLQDRLWQHHAEELLLPPTPSGEPALRRAIVDHICAPGGLKVELRQVLIAPDPQAALRLIGAVQDVLHRRGAGPGAAEQTIYLCRLGELLFPAFPLSFLTAPLPLLPLFEAQLDLLPAGPPRSDQLVLARFLGTGGFAAHLRRQRPIAFDILRTTEPANRLAI